MKNNAAICVPLTLGGAPAAFLYLDSRGTLPTSLRPNASSFCVALGRIASLALANLKRITMEKREAQFRAELDAAAVAQKWILPKRVSQFGPLAAIGESKPGQFVGGDFFDVVPLDGGKLGVGLGDVSGKGISASVLMTAAQGFFNARVSDDPDIARAVNALNRFVNPRRPANKFVTLWAGVIDPAAGTLRYVDAGHSYALLRRANGTIEQLDVGGGLPIGIDEDAEYQATETTIGPGDAVIVVSDGIIEQFGVTTDASGEREQFGVAKLSAAIAAEPDDPVAELFKAVVAHAGTDKLADDATVVWVKWGPAQTA
jgi:sigma-B regulation protein RsbU (phosphoserine phosphatase)